MDRRTLRVLEFDKVVNKLAGFTASSLGRELAEAVVPSADTVEVEKMLKETDDALSFIVRLGSPPLGGIRDIRAGLKRVDVGAVLNPGELLACADVLRICRNLKNYAGEVDDDECQGNFVKELIGCLKTGRKIEDKIRAAIISEEEISDNASPALRSIRRHIAGLQNSIKERLLAIIKSSRHQKFVQDSVVTIRGDRYVIPVKQEYRAEIPGLIHDSSSSGATVFIEPMAVVEANNEIKQLKIKEQVEIEKILKELTGDVASISDMLKDDVSILAKLDFIFARAKLSLDYECVRPRMNARGAIIIKEGRHPLLDRKTVVPIDFALGDEFNTLVITGPNTGGKTVTLKTVGLFVLMAQAGMHVPAAEGTSISVFDKVFADIGDEQSIEQSLSTFSSHMTNIVRILENAGNKSLVLLDELGAGTDPTEGAALAMAILDRLRNLGAVTAATTHYSELKMYAISTVGVNNASCEFDIETLRPTYRLLMGIPGKSNAFDISARLGLDCGVLERAKEYLSREKIDFEDILLSIEKNRIETENEKARAQCLRIEAETLKNELEAQKSKLSANRDRIIREAREEARRILVNAKHEAKSILDELKKLREEQEGAAKSAAMEELRARLNRSIDAMDASPAEELNKPQEWGNPPESLKPGDSVIIIGLNQMGTVKRPPDKDGEAIIQVGIMEVNINVSNLRLIDARQDAFEKTGAGRIALSKAASISPQIDLRGQTVDEALDKLDKYLDDADIASLNEITIIHGKGTGALRDGVHRFLKSSPRIKSFRLGKYGEGESGVTIAELK